MIPTFISGAGAPPLSAISRRIRRRLLNSSAPTISADWKEGAVAGGYLAKLKTQLADYELETRLLMPPPSNRIPQSLTLRLGGSACEFGKGFPSFRHPLRRLKADCLQRNPNCSNSTRQSEREHLRPQHPKIVKLDAISERTNASSKSTKSKISSRWPRPARRRNSHCQC